MEISFSKLKKIELKNYLNQLGFDSMVKEKTWDKYIKTFERLRYE